jgi:hypothetical protein
LTGSAGRAIVNSSPSSSSAASMVGPMLPRSVESNVLQYLIWKTRGSSWAASRMASSVRW